MRINCHFLKWIKKIIKFIEIILLLIIDYNISPNPINLQWPLKFLASPTLFPFSATIGIFNKTSIASFFIFSTVPTVIVVLTLIISISFVFIGSTGFLSSAPKTSLNNFVFIFALWFISGSFPLIETRHPVRESDFVKIGSRFVSMEMLAPGTTLEIDWFPLYKEIIFVVNV